METFSLIQIYLGSEITLERLCTSTVNVGPCGLNKVISCSSLRMCQECDFRWLGEIKSWTTKNDYTACI